MEADFADPPDLGWSFCTVCFSLLVSNQLRIAYILLHLDEEEKQPLEIPYMQSIGSTRYTRYRCGLQRRFEVYLIRSSGLSHHPACIETGKVHSCPSDTLEMAAMTSRFPSGHHWHGSTRVPSLKNRLVPTVAYKPNLSQLRTH